MGESATGNQGPAAQPAAEATPPASVAPGDQTSSTAARTPADENAASADSLEAIYAPGESPMEVSAQDGETAREVAAEHLARLLYTPTSTWSRYVFHENEPHPFRGSRERPSRG